MKPPTTCPLCGHALDGSVPCQRCPLQQGCALLCCPNCGYQVVDESKSLIVRLVGQLGRYRRAPVGTLGAVSLGEDVEIACMDGLSPAQLQRLSAYGLVPGKSVRVLQRWPSPVVRVGQTELAVERGILEGIQVRMSGGSAPGYSGEDGVDDGR